MSNTGTAAEYRVRDAMRNAGWYVVRSPASKGSVDLLAVAPGVAAFVQVKRGQGRLYPEEWNALLDLAARYGGVPVLAEAVPRRPIAWWRLTQRKTPGWTGTRQPKVAWDPSRPGARVVAAAAPFTIPPGSMATLEDGTPDLGPLPRLEGDMIVKNWHYRGP